ncbi:MAG: hypothetical protein ACSHW2_04855 [Parasphingopyxis sp.]
MFAFAVNVPAVALVQDQATASENEAAVQEEDPSQRVRCRNRRVTGSNARRIRVCMTIAEWSELARNGNRDARRLLDDAQRDSTNRNIDPGFTVGGPQ